MNSPNRVQSIDFWRGVILLTIFINHVSGNPIANWTPHNFGFSDSAEAFVFLAGCAVALAFGRRIDNGEIAAVARRNWKRAATLYVVHVSLTIFAIACFAFGLWLGVDQELIAGHGRDIIFAQPTAGLIGTLALTHQLDYFDILPMYVVFLLVAPAMLWLVRRRPALLLALSFSLYLIVQFTGLNLPSWPILGGWYFNPFAWQLMFVLGMIACTAGDRLPFFHSQGLLVAAAVIVAASLVVMTDIFGLWRGLSTTVWSSLATDKSQLGWTRVLHFLALALVLKRLHLGDSLARLPALQSVVRLGQNGLFVFAVGSALTAVANTMVAARHGDIAFSVLVVSSGLALHFLCVPAKTWLSSLISSRRNAGMPASAAS